MSSQEKGISKFFKRKPQSNTSQKSEVILLSSSSDGEGEDLFMTSKSQKSNPTIKTETSKDNVVTSAKASSTAEKDNIKVDKKYDNVQDLLNDIESVDLDNITTKVVDVKSFYNKASNDSQTDSGIPVDEDTFASGSPDCLIGLTIVFTGVLPTLERSVAESIAKKYGAKVTKSISGRTSLVVLGDEAGPSKVAKIKQLKIKCINEEGFRQLVNGSPATGGGSVEAKKALEKRERDEKKMEKEIEMQIREQQKHTKDSVKSEKSSDKISDTAKSTQDPSTYKLKTDESQKLWTYKYAPKSLNELCGNKTLITRLQNWLKAWDSNYKKGFKSPGPDGNGIYRAAMLSGPPGIGKTTAAHLVAESLGFSVLEKNASDVRSKNQLNDTIKGMLGGTSINSYFMHSKRELKENKNFKKFVLIMDEVDGMSGGDRGGVGALTSFIRKTKTPIILICNERRIPKMRPFDRICLELPFRRPDARSVIPRLMSIAYKEKFRLEPSAIEQLVQVSGGDIRLMINILNINGKSNKAGITKNNIEGVTSNAGKDVSIKIFDVTAQLLNGGIYTPLGSKNTPLWKKMEWYFCEYQFCSLMIQENYITTRPTTIPVGKTHLQCLGEAADSISLGDVIDKNIRDGGQLWSLMPAHAIISSILPASKIAGTPSRINFASWLGQNSTSGKFIRLLQDLYYHSKICISGTRTTFRTEYIPTLKQVLLLPILSEGSAGIPETIKRLDSYYLSKEDWDTIMTFLIGSQNTALDLKSIPTAVKSAFTRQYNSTSHPVSIYHSATAVTSSGETSGSVDLEEAIDQDEVETKNEDEGEDDDIESVLKKDKLLSAAKPKKRPAAGKAATKKTVKKRKV